MSLAAQAAKQLHDVYFGGNWTVSNLKEQLSTVNWQQATTQVGQLNTIAKLAFHLNYYVHEVAKVLQGEPLTAKDKFSWEPPAINNEDDWQQLLGQLWQDGQRFSELIGQLPDSKFAEPFIAPQYGDYYRNIHGIIEHIHYHLGQIAVIKKLL
ncbi:MAG: DinB family protein [Candidatus Pseudobacter hemicellulosilyticus]|uniref:DinB family protein n=1 Tax=Candidatus Pseudobacter hemicellulosilyticus TaxID=3121375 RepID=A0AAJ5WWU0_9BACT|nr:MAG: DinB family protein [Pseudobacter sp.]